MNFFVELPSEMNISPNLREFVKEELQKLLNVNFIYPISNSQWVSPLVVVPKRMENGACVLTIGN